MNDMTPDRYKQFSAFQVWVEEQHEGQKRKYSETPYFGHCIKVARLVANTPDCDLVTLCTALGHDLLEDTPNTEGSISEALQKFGFDSFDVGLIMHGITSLTNTFTSTRFPDKNRIERLDMYLNQLKHNTELYPWIHTIKYADIIDNCRNIRELDPTFAETYLEEKRLTLAVLTGGDPKLYQLALNIVNN